MQNLIKQILEKYRIARTTSAYNSQNEVFKLFKELTAIIADFEFIKTNPNLVTKFSCGIGNWAAIPHLSINDKRVTKTLENGVYIVLLFGEDGEGCHLKLGQGVTNVVKEHGKKRAKDILGESADSIRLLFNEDEYKGFDTKAYPRISKAGELYEASTILSKIWLKDSLPSNESIENDFKILVNCYKKYADSYQLANPNLTKKIWAIATGKDGSQWDDFLNNGVAAIGFQDIGSLDQYKTQDEITNKLLPFSDDGSKPTNDSLCMFQFAKEIQVGDIVVAKSGRKLIRGAGVVKSEYIYDPARPDHPHLRKVEWLRTTETEFPDTGTTIKTLTEISRYPEFKLFVENYLNMHTSSSGPYGVQQIIDEGCFASSQEIQGIIERLKSKKNIILQGPPGTGKTWLAKRLGYALIGEKNIHQLKAVQFHPNLSYEDFVRGWRPSGEGKLSLIDGPFMEAINKAKNSSAPYVVVIEEINRGNPAQIFGEMLTLLESDKRNADEGLELSYRKSDDERVYIPENLYVIGTMNIADRSLALVDLALRRRFAFIDLKPNINSAWKSWLVDKIKIPSNIANEIQQRMISLNDQISKDQSLGSQYQIGHSYVTPTSPITDPKEWFKQVVQTEIYPLLNEYWFDNPDNAIKIRDQLLQDF
jgi:MoxR-like ATPase